MIRHPSFRVEPWTVHGTQLDLALLAQSESPFALSNGHIGLRGNLDEGEPHRADVELGGDPELQQAVRFALFHVLQAVARAERRAIPAKGLTGTGYDGHSFWDPAPAAIIEYASRVS